MKQKLLLLIILVFSNKSLAQNLSLDEILKLRKNDIGYVEEYLTNKGWNFLEAKEPSEEEMGSATFTYKKSDFDNTAQSFLYFMYSGHSERKRIGIQVNKVDVYNTYISRIKSFGCTLTDSKVVGSDIVKIYVGETTTFKITTTTVTNDFNSKKTIYHFLICDNIDYLMNFTE